jgi:hypothetical protein
MNMITLFCRSESIPFILAIMYILSVFLGGAKAPPYMR